MPRILFSTGFGDKKRKSREEERIIIRVSFFFERGMNIFTLLRYKSLSRARNLGGHMCACPGYRGFTAFFIGCFKIKCRFNELATNV